MEKRCVLDETRRCVECGECLMCDLDPNKLCDNCMRCVQKSGADYLAIEIDEVINGTSPDDDEDAIDSPSGPSIQPDARQNPHGKGHGEPD